VLIAVIADTHMSHGRRRLPERCVEIVSSADLVIHAGDLVTEDALVEIETIGPPVAAVHGNVDEPALVRALPAERTVALGDASIAVLHDAGPHQGRLERMRLRFPEADAVVFGHSHMPLHETKGGFQIFNPGSPTDRRRSPSHTMGLARVGGGEVSFELIMLDR
jgi:putative phosphoesterase